ncbi:MAG: hypothetical protein U9Q99_02425 [Nanoarchaeota archaeon]|nr:hypothetical protein [Nanoarchaeota archaeon]
MNNKIKDRISNFSLKNRRANLAVVILVIGTFAVCALALLTFYVSDSKISTSFVSLHLMEQMNVQIDEFKFYSSKNVSIESLNNFNVVEEDGLKWIKIEKKKPASKILFFKEGEDLLFSVQYPISS